eukprot:COSAG02_NODE_25905_length_646_cov_0.502742_1_plen_94_part_10
MAYSIRWLSSLTHFFATAGVDALRPKSFPTVETWNSVYVVDLTHEDDQVVGEAMRTRSLPTAPACVDCVLLPSSCATLDRGPDPSGLYRGLQDY